ncbi:MAG: SDR family oxidoreductase [Thermoguttaceae bacterium]
MQISFENQVALVTGAAQGMGLATSNAFAKAGATVILSDVNEREVIEASAKLKADGYKTFGVRCDVAKEDDVKNMVQQIVQQFGRLDFAFNNAGVQSPAKNITELTSDEYDRIMNINLRGVWLCMKYELLQMQKQQSGAIVNNSSLGGLVGLPGRAAYHASKHGVLGLTKSAALEFAIQNIRINAICPGTIDTPMVQAMFRAGDLSRDDLARLQPIGRLGTAEEIAETVLWLCSPGAGFIIGQSIPIDGGYTIQ